MRARSKKEKQKQHQHDDKEAPNKNSAAIPKNLKVAAASQKDNPSEAMRKKADLIGKSSRK